MMASVGTHATVPTNVLTDLLINRHQVSNQFNDALSDALRHYRLIPNDAVRHFSDGVLHSPVLDLFIDLC